MLSPSNKTTMGMWRLLTVLVTLRVPLVVATVPESGFLFAVIALESLFSRDAGTPTLADSIALLTESKMEARNAVAKRLKQIYDRRSEIVHSGKHEVSSEDLQDAIQFCVRSLFEILTFAASWGNTQDACLKRLTAANLVKNATRSAESSTLGHLEQILPPGSQ
jgi:hypothetical protein